MFHYQLKIADLYNICIDNVKKLIKKICDLLWKLEALLEARVKTKKIHHVLEFNQSQWLKQYVEFNTQE